mmetsp:Transcript_135597/g.248935  ORF Transcript_135597/g.248935 Transcript_135597/m.248935 type:complete len:221 (-) Transcript_135597:719-1381(-)
MKLRKMSMAKKVVEIQKISSPASTSKHNDRGTRIDSFTMKRRDKMSQQILKVPFGDNMNLLLGELHHDSLTCMFTCFADLLTVPSTAPCTFAPADDFPFSSGTESSAVVSIGTTDFVFFRSKSCVLVFARSTCETTSAVSRKELTQLSILTFLLRVGFIVASVNSSTEGPTAKLVVCVKVVSVFDTGVSLSTFSTFSIFSAAGGCSSQMPSHSSTSSAEQ